jgi:hypothetical protein
LQTFLLKLEVSVRDPAIPCSPRATTSPSSGCGWDEEGERTRRAHPELVEGLWETLHELLCFHYGQQRRASEVDGVERETRRLREGSDGEVTSRRTFAGENNRLHTTTTSSRSYWSDANAWRRPRRSRAEQRGARSLRCILRANDERVSDVGLASNDDSDALDERDVERIPEGVADAGSVDRRRLLHVCRGKERQISDERTPIDNPQPTVVLHVGLLH